METMVRIRREHACRFLLTKNGLLGAGMLRGREGVLDYVQQAGCLQYDPVDVCGCSHELSLLARVKGFTREMLEALLYQERALIDYFDKNMCIMLTQDWPCLSFLREHFRQSVRLRAPAEAARALEQAHACGHLSAQQLSAQMNDSQARSVLEALYFRGDLVIHHKEGPVKSYAVAQDCLPPELLHTPSPFANERERQMWQVMRRIGAVGMLWNAPSDAWLGVEGLTAQARMAVFQALYRIGVIAPVEVEGVSLPLFMLAEDLPLLAKCQAPFPAERRARLLPPLDCLLWDRRLIAELFGFSYKWEAYTPEHQRRYGYYVLPVIFGEGFAGRVEPVYDRAGDALVVRRFWPEAGLRLNDRFLWALEDALDQLRHFNGASRLVWAENWLANGQEMQG